MKLKEIALFAAVLLFPLLSCSKDKENDGDGGDRSSLNVAPSVVSLDASGTPVTLQVTAPGAWSASCEADWLSLDPMRGDGNASVRVSATASTGTRIAEILFRSDDAQFFVSVTQKGGSGGGGDNPGGDDNPAVGGSTVTLDFTAQGYADQQNVESLTKEGVTASFTNAKWYDNGSAVRAYHGSTFTVSSSKQIVKIEFTFGERDNTNVITATPGSYSEPSWTGAAGRVAFSVEGENGHRRIAKMKVTLGTEDSGETPGGDDNPGGGDDNPGGDTPGGSGGTDVLDLAFTGIAPNSSTYTDWSGKKGSSGAVYAGNSAGGNSAIQLRTKTEDSGIVTTVSGGKVSEVSVVWNSNNSDKPAPRVLNIYGKDTAYTGPADLYSSSTQGTLLGSITCGSTTSVSVSGNYAFIGIRSAENALYLDRLTINWK